MLAVTAHDHCSSLTHRTSRSGVEEREKTERISLTDQRYVTAQRLTPPPLPTLPLNPPPARPAKGWRKGLEFAKGMVMPATALMPSPGFHLIQKYVQSRVLIDGLNILFQLGLLWFMTAHVGPVSLAAHNGRARPVRVAMSSEC